MSPSERHRLRIARERAGPTRIGPPPAAICARGHLQEGENVGIRSNGSRWCRVCERDRGRERRGG